MPGHGGISQPWAPGHFQGKAMDSPWRTGNCTYMEALEQEVSGLEKLSEHYRGGGL